MGKDNKCKPVFNYGLPGKKRIACSVCGSIWEDGIPTSCKNCHRRVKKNGFLVERA